MREVAASMYVRRHFSPMAKNVTLEIIGYVRRIFKKILKELVLTKFTNRLRKKCIQMLILLHVGLDG